MSYNFSRNPIFLTMGPEEVISIPMDKRLEFSIPQFTPWVEVISGIMTTFSKKKTTEVFLVSLRNLLVPRLPDILVGDHATIKI